MPSWEWLILFVQIGFAIFILAPTIATSLRLPINPVELMRLFWLTWAQYAVMVVAVLVSAFSSKQYVLGGVPLITAVISACGFRLVMKWVLIDQMMRGTEPQQSRWLGPTAPPDNGDASG